MTIKVKFRCTEKNNRGYSPSDKPTCSVKLQAVSDPANKTWAKYTPGGSVELTIDNPEAYEAFELGKFYFAAFTPAPSTEAEE